MADFWYRIVSQASHSFSLIDPIFFYVHSWSHSTQETQLGGDRDRDQGHWVQWCMLSTAQERESGSWSPDLELASNQEWRVCVHLQQVVPVSHPHKCIRWACGSDGKVAKHLLQIMLSVLPSPPPPTMGHGKYFQPDALGQAPARRWLSATQPLAHFMLH